jgi:NAD(P)H dehydrogenase (quinone)
VSITYAITGASGQLGRLAVLELLHRGVAARSVVLVVRDPSKVEDLRRRGAEVRVGDYDDPAALSAALAGVDRLLLVSGSDPGRRIVHHANVIDAAVGAGVSLIAYTSMLNADTATNPLALQHRATEKALRAAGVDFVALRNGWYTENYAQGLEGTIGRGELYGAAGAGCISVASRRDYAAAAAAVLEDPPPGGGVVELGGPAVTMPAVAAAISRVTGRDVAYRDLPPSDYVRILQGVGLDEGTARFVTELDEAIARGELETASDDLARLVGRPLESPDEVFRDAYAAIRAD